MPGARLDVEHGGGDDDSPESLSEGRFGELFIAEHLQDGAALWRVKNVLSGQREGARLWVPDAGWLCGAEAWYAAKRKMFEIIKRRCIEEGPQENKRGEGINESAKYLARHYMNQRAEGALGKATTAENVFTAPEKWNAEGWLLGLPDGLVCELRRGRSGVRAQKPEDLIDLRAGVVPDWKCPAPVFFSLLNYFADGDEYFMNDILAGLASGLVGKAYRRIYVLLGPSGCGKSRLLMIASALIGDYVTALSREAFASRTQGSNKYALGNLPDKRMALAAELEGGYWHGAFIKALVSGDLLESEQKYQKAHPFKPVVTLFLMANPAQMARSYVRDNALLERLVIWPFTKRLDEARDPDTGKSLWPQAEGVDIAEYIIRHEGPGVLAMLIDAAQALPEPPDLPVSQRVREAVNEYAERSDNVGDWIKECCERKPDARVSTDECYTSYRQWCKEQERKPLGKNYFGYALDEHGIRSKPDGKIRTRRGLRLIGSPSLEV